ncbi:MAG: cytochrome c biogenesis protein CcdA [Acidimicrobiia bacterium]
MLLLTVGTVGIGLAGYMGFRLYPTFDVGAGTGLGLLVLAAAAGFAAFFSPCSFPLLLTLLGRQVEQRIQTGGRLRSAVRFATGAAIGASLFVLGLGVLLTAAGAQIASQLTFTAGPGRAVRVVVGVLLVVLGLAQLGFLRVPFGRIAGLAAPIERRHAAFRDRDSFSRHVAYGFGYLLAGFGCTGPLLAGLAAQGVVIGSVPAGLLTFGTAALVIVGLFFIAAMFAVLAKQSTVQAFRTSGPAVRRWGGRVLIGVGVWFIVLGAFADMASRLVL